MPFWVWLLLWSAFAHSAHFFLLELQSMYILHNFMLEILNLLFVSFNVC